MAQAPTDTGSHAELEEKILRELRGAGTPMKTLELAQRCEVPKATLNRTLYRMKKESKVFQTDQAKWSLAPESSRPGSQAEKAASSQENRICQFLAAGPQSALQIAQFLGYSSARHVNPTLYKMQANHRLYRDSNSNSWALSQPEAGGGGRGPVIIQHKSVTVHIQNPTHVLLGDNSYAVSDVSALQIGDHCRLVLDSAELHTSCDAPTFPPASQSGEGATQEGPSSLCPLEDTPAGHGGRMVDSPRPAGPEAGRKESRKPEGDTGPATPATQPTDECGQDGGQLSAHLAAVRLESQDGAPPGMAPDVQGRGSL